MFTETIKHLIKDPKRVIRYLIEKRQLKKNVKKFIKALTCLFSFDIIKVIKKEKNTWQKVFLWYNIGTFKGRDFLLKVLYSHLLLIFTQLVVFLF